MLYLPDPYFSKDDIIVTSHYAITCIDAEMKKIEIMYYDKEVLELGEYSYESKNNRYVDVEFKSGEQVIKKVLMII